MDSKKEPAEMIYEVAVLRGPSAIAFAQWMEKEPALSGRKMQVKVLDSPEQMQALLVKGEADVAVLPMISAANLYNKGIRYPLLGCPIWGTLYLVGHERIVPPVYCLVPGRRPTYLPVIIWSKKVLTPMTIRLQRLAKSCCHCRRIKYRRPY